MTALISGLGDCGSDSFTMRRRSPVYERPSGMITFLPCYWASLFHEEWPFFHPETQHVQAVFNLTWFDIWTCTSCPSCPSCPSKENPKQTFITWLSNSTSSSFFWELKCLRLSIMAPTRTPKQRPIDIATRPNASTQGRQVMTSSHKHHCYVGLSENRVYSQL